MFTVRAPGSSANLGSGFDVLGVAIDRHAWVADQRPAGRPDAVACPPDHIVHIAHRAAGGSGDLWFWFDLKPGRGMGFSGAARAAGAVLAFLQQGLDPNEARDRGYDVVCELEGHGDNAAPSVFGGLHIVTGPAPGSPGGWHHHRVDAELPGQLVLWVPVEQSATDQSRRALPRNVAMADAVFNSGRIALLMAALYEGRPDLLARATEDRLHQPPRLATLRGSDDALHAALDAGADAGWLSGSGPSVAIVVDPDRLAVVTDALPSDGEVIHLGLDRSGTVGVGDSRPVDPVG